MESFMQPALYQGRTGEYAPALRRWIGRWRARRETTRQLRTLARFSERELRDIGVTRADVFREVARR